jgi:hypothetical protein
VLRLTLAVARMHAHERRRHDRTNGSTDHGDSGGGGGDGGSGGYATSPREPYGASPLAKRHGFELISVRSGPARVANPQNGGEGGGGANGPPSARALRAAARAEGEEGGAARGAAAAGGVGEDEAALLSSLPLVMAKLLVGAEGPAAPLSGASLSAAMAAEALLAA